MSDPETSCYQHDEYQHECIPCRCRVIRKENEAAYKRMGEL